MPFIYLCFVFIIHVIQLTPQQRLFTPFSFLVTEMSGLALLTQLQTLELSANKLKRVVSTGLANLEELWLNSNPIVDAPAVAQLAQVIYIYVCVCVVCCI